MTPRADLRLMNSTKASSDLRGFWPPRLGCQVAMLTGLLAGMTAAAQATSGITCTSRGGRTEVDVTVSLSNTTPHDGVVSMALSHSGIRSHWLVRSARADYRRQTMIVHAHTPAGPPHTLRLHIDQNRGRLLQGSRPVVMTCDWGEFSRD